MLDWVGECRRGQQALQLRLRLDGPDASAAWALQGNGQIKLGSSNMCLSQSGAAPGNADLAASSSVIASSTLDPAHGAALAVDGLDASYWVSKLDEASPVTLTVELDEPAPVRLSLLLFQCKSQAELASERTYMPQTPMSSRRQPFH